MRFLGALAVLSLLAALPSRGQAGGSNPKRAFAVVVGVNKFPDPGAEWLQFADHDAELLQQYFKARNIEAAILINAKATRANIKDALDRIERTAGPGQDVYLFISSNGRATQRSGEGFVGTADGFGEKPQTAIGLSDLRKFLVNCGARVLLFADVSREQPVLKGVDQGLDNRINNALLDLRKFKSDLYGVLATEPSTASLESPQLKAGLFGYYLVRGLQGGSDSSRPSGTVTFDRVFGYLLQNLPDLSRQLAKRPQKPTPVGKADSKVSLAGLYGDPLRRRLPVLLAQAGPLQRGLLAATTPATLDAETRKLADELSDTTRPGGLMDIARASALLDQLRSREGSITGEESRHELSVALEDAGQHIVAQYGTGDQFPDDPRKLRKEHFELSGRLFLEARKLREEEAGATAEATFCRDSEGDPPVRLRNREDILALEAKRRFSMGRALLADELKLTGQTQNSTATAEAGKHLECAVELDPAMPEAQNALGIVKLLNADFASAQAYFNTAKDRAPSWAYARHNLALTYIEMGQNRDAEQEYEEAIQRTPFYPYLYYNLGLLLQRQNKTKEAEKVYNGSLSIFDRQIDRYKSRADRSRADGDASEQKLCADVASVLERNKAEALNSLGALEESRRKFKQAESRYVEALQLNASLLPARHNLALLYARNGDLPKATTLWEENARRDPTFHPSRLKLGATYLAAHDGSKAEPEYRSVLTANPDNTEARLGLASALDLQGKSTAAVELLTAATPAQKDNPEIATRLGDLYLKQGDETIACREYRKASAISRHSVAGDKRVLKKKLNACKDLQ